MCGCSPRKKRYFPTGWFDVFSKRQPCWYHPIFFTFLRFVRFAKQVLSVQDGMATDLWNYIAQNFHSSWVKYTQSRVLKFLQAERNNMCSLSIYLPFLGQKYSFLMAWVPYRYLNWLTCKYNLHLGGREKMRLQYFSSIKGGASRMGESNGYHPFLSQFCRSFPGLSPIPEVAKWAFTWHGSKNLAL